jgi:hypothetical protein
MSNPQQTSSEDEFAADEKVEFQLSVQVDPDLIKNFPADVAQDFGVLPLGRFGEKSLVLAADEELSPARFKELRKRLGGQVVHIVPSSGSEVRRLAEGVLNQDGVSRKQDQTAQLVPAEEPNPKALEYAEQSKYETEPKELSQILVDLSFLSKKELESHLKEQKDKDHPHFDPSSFVDAKILRLIPEKLAVKHQILPLKRVLGDLLVASSGYPDASLVSEIRQVTGLMPKLILTEAEELEAGIKECYERRHYLRAEEMRLGDYLLAEGFIDKNQLDICLREQKTSKEKLGELLVRHGYVSEDVTFMYL